jgi:hypothetical protein
MIADNYCNLALMENITHMYSLECVFLFLLHEVHMRPRSRSNYALLFLSTSCMIHIHENTTNDTFLSRYCIPHSTTLRSWLVVSLEKVTKSSELMGVQR